MDDKYKGTTVNERLYLSGLMDKFDKAVSEKNVDVIISILEEVELTGSNIDEILKFNKLIDQV
ncbi:hypothetical protein E2R66_24545 [Mucilaginibacter psychrotolerans]|uniref:Uncharacterized protein n=1 Tax=Mucilaginibacter psychrotolerans TaxID=1524096 RepID=A0A4Y8S493_9SPHI|nr:hypothetical protein E2R66_24545 [Mucilaginibacter psychrotolerans]